MQMQCRRRQERRLVKHPTLCIVVEFRAAARKPPPVGGRLFRVIPLGRKFWVSILHKQKAPPFPMSNLGSNPTDAAHHCPKLLIKGRDWHSRPKQDLELTSNTAMQHNSYRHSQHTKEICLWNDHFGAHQVDIARTKVLRAISAGRTADSRGAGGSTHAWRL